MRDVYDMDVYLEYLLHDSQASMWDDSKKLAALNASYNQVVNRIIEAHENWFYTETTLSPGTAAWERTPYDMPSTKTIVKILLLTDSNGRPIEPINLSARDYTYPIISNRNLQTGYWLGHDKLYVNADAFTETLRLYYIRRPPTLLYGTASAGSATTLTLASTPPFEHVDDYYNNTVLWLRGGTGAGESAEITDFVGSTGVCTVDFATTPDDTSVYASESELPHGHNEIVVVGAAIRALMFDVGQATKLQELKDLYKKLEFDLLDFVESRQLQASRSVHVRNYD